MRSSLVVRSGAVLLWLSVSACGVPVNQDFAELEAEIRNQFPSVPQLSPTDLEAWLADPDRPRPLLVDVRAPEEFAVSHLAGARPARSVAEVETLAGPDRDLPIVLYCSVGYRSSALAAQLQSAGFRQVRNLEGSIFRWANEGRPVVRDGRAVRAVHPYDERWGRFLQRDLWSFEP